MSKLYNILLKKWKYFMAKPRSIDFGDNKKILISNFPKEEADKLQAYLKAYGQPQAQTSNTVEQVAQILETSLLTSSSPSEENKELDQTALSFHKEGNLFFVTELKFNPVSGIGKVVATRQYDNKVVAQSEFKLDCFKKGMV